MIKLLLDGLIPKEDEVFRILQGVSLRLLYINSQTVAVLLRQNAEEARSFELLFKGVWYINIPTQISSINASPASEEDVDVVRQRVPIAYSPTRNQIMRFASGRENFYIMASRLTLYEVDTLDDCSHARTDEMMTELAEYYSVGDTFIHQ